MTVPTTHVTVDDALRVDGFPCPVRLTVDAWFSPAILGVPANLTREDGPLWRAFMTACASDWHPAGGHDQRPLWFEVTVPAPGWDTAALRLVYSLTRETDQGGNAVYTMDLVRNYNDTWATTPSAAI
jgi:hypothetical protein